MSFRGPCDSAEREKENIILISAEEVTAAITH